MLRCVSWIVFWPTVFTAEREIFPPKMRVHVVKAKCRETLGCRSLQIPMWPWQVAFCRFVWNRYQGTDYDYRLPYSCRWSWESYELRKWLSFTHFFFSQSACAYMILILIPRLGFCENAVKFLLTCLEFIWAERSRICWKLVEAPMMRSLKLFAWGIAVLVRCLDWNDSGADDFWWFGVQRWIVYPHPHLPWSHHAFWWLHTSDWGIFWDPPRSPCCTFSE